jgi:cytochrome c biogenesis protein CcdA
MSKLRPFILTILLVSALFSVAHASKIDPANPFEFTGVTEPTPYGEGGVIYADLFYGEGCLHCTRVRSIVEEFAEKYPQVHVHYREICFNTTNREIYWNVLDRCGVEFEVIPLFIIGNMVLAGKDDICAGLESYVPDATQNNLNQPVLSPSLLQLMEEAQKTGESGFKDSIAPHDTSPSSRADVTLVSVLVAAVVDSVNPCAIAVLAVLLAYLTSLNDRRRLLQTGFAYIGTVFIVYFLSGLGLLAIVQKSGISDIVFTLAAIVAVIAGLINIGEALLKHGGFSLSIPKSQRERISRYIQRASVPSAVVLAALVSVVELPCTGGMYLAILGLLSNRMTFAEGLPYLVLYNLVFVLPLMAILLIVYYGASPGRVDAWREEKRRYVRFIMGSVMLGLGGAMLLGLL